MTKIQKMVLGLSAVVLAASVSVTRSAQAADPSTPTTPPAPSTSATVTGKVFYKSPSGTIAMRETSLEVPAEGRGSVILKSGTKEIKSEEFRSKKMGNRTVFVVKFSEIPDMETELQGKTMILKGTYLRGSDSVLYYGDLYSLSKSDDRSLDGFLSLADRDHDDHDDDHDGGHHRPRHPRHCKPDGHGDGHHGGHGRCEMPTHLGGFHFEKSIQD